MTSMGSGYNKKEEVYGFQTFYRELGYYINRLEQYDRALRYFNQAVNKVPYDKRALLGRAWARSKVIEYEGALDDIRRALDLDPEDLAALAPKALNTYLNGEFEEGLRINNHLRGRRIKPDHFVMGVMHCTEAIENCIGDRAGHPLRDHFKIIRKLAWKKYYDSLKPYEPKTKYKKKKKKKKVSAEGIMLPKPRKSQEITRKSKASYEGVPKERSLQMTPKEANEEGSIRESLHSRQSDKNIIPPGPHFPHKPLQNYTSNIKAYMAEKYLSIMYRDKLFLENMINEPGVRSPNKDGTCKLLEAAKNGHKLICYKEERLRSRRPFYFIKYQECQVGGALKARQEAEAIRLRQTAIKDAQKLKNKLIQAVYDRDLLQALQIADKLKEFCDTKPKHVLPDREQYLSLIYDAVCQAHYDSRRLNPNQDHKAQEKRIYVLFGLPVSSHGSTDSVRKYFTNVFIDWKKLIGVYENRLKAATCMEEMTWIYHELARFHAETKQYELSRMYARKCIQNAIECENPKWVVNASMLITRVYVCQQNRNDAKNELGKVAELAKEIKDKNLQDYIKKCQETLETIAFDDFRGPKLLERREKKIIQMLQGHELKNEARHLFSMMSAIPVRRRMFILPGIRLEDSPENAQRRRMTIKATKVESSSSLRFTAKLKKKLATGQMDSPAGSRVPFGVSTSGVLR